jgi:CMP-N-acetylneuraminic acid synthetase
MHVVGSIIARLGSKRLPYKNLMPFAGKPLIGVGIEILRQAKRVDTIVVSTESELIARIAHGFGATVLRRPEELAADNIPSVPVFRHIIEHYPCDAHVNLNINFPLCHPAVIDRAIGMLSERNEVLSNPFAVWAQTAERLRNYGDPWAPETKAFLFDDERAGTRDVHTLDDLLALYREVQGPLPGWS